jgi:cytochrome bd-type quinol oxidase subunit 2
VAAALLLTAVSAWLASGAEFTADATAASWSWLDIAQVPAIVLGAGVLAVVLARWMPFPGSLLIGFVGLVVGTGWLVSGAPEVRPWLAPYVAIEWWSDDGALRGSPVWHLAYLLALSGLGVCVVALRQAERRTGWLTAGAIAFAAVITAGLLQLPALS